jgi:hypothetical protein
VAGREGIVARRQGWTVDAEGGQPGVRPRAADEVLDAELQQPGGRERQHAEPGRVVEP